MKVQYKAILKSIARYEETGVLDDDRMQSLADFEFYYGGGIETDIIYKRCLPKVTVIFTPIKEE